MLSSETLRLKWGGTRASFLTAESTRSRGRQGLPRPRFRRTGSVLKLQDTTKVYDHGLANGGIQPFGPTAGVSQIQAVHQCWFPQPELCTGWHPWRGHLSETYHKDTAAPEHGLIIRTLQKVAHKATGKTRTSLCKQSPTLQRPGEKAFCLILIEGTPAKTRRAVEVWMSHNGHCRSVTHQLRPSRKSWGPGAVKASFPSENCDENFVIETCGKSNPRLIDQMWVCYLLGNAFLVGTPTKPSLELYQFDYHQSKPPTVAIQT